MPHDTTSAVPDESEVGAEDQDVEGEANGNGDDNNDDDEE